MMNKVVITLMLSLLGLFTTPVYAVLARVGPVSVAAGNYPAFYQDATGLALELCLPDPGLERDRALCLHGPEDFPNGTGATVFPSNFPEENFWWNGTALIDLPSGGRARLVMALEAAFSNGPVAVGDQIVFARHRILVDIPEPGGHYTVTTPIGIQEFDAEPGPRAIFFSDDVGDVCGTDFSCALNGAVGPFLLPSATPGGDPLPPVVIGGKTYIADQAVENFVTDGPFGHIFKIEGPNIGGAGINVVQTDQFSLRE
jgi:hypothetical protein